MLALALLFAAQAAQPTGAVLEAKPKLLVIDFRDDGVGPDVVRIVHDTLVTHLSRDARIEIISSEDVRRAMQQEAERRELTNCDDESCLAEIAEALGAQLTIYGTAGKLGELVVVNVNLFDARAARSIGRETVEVSSLEALPTPLRVAGDRLIGKLGLAPAEPPLTAGDMLFGTGVGVTAAGLATVVGGVATLFIMQGARDGADSFQEKTDAKVAEDVGAGVAIGGAIGAALGAAVLATSFAVE